MRRFSIRLLSWDNKSFRKLHHRKKPLRGPLAVVSSRWWSDTSNSGQTLCCSGLHGRIKALHALRDAVIGEEEGVDAEKWILLDPTAEPSRTLEQQSLCSILSLPPPCLQNKEPEREEASLQVELNTDAPGSSKLMQGCLYCAEPCCLCI